MFHFKQGIDIGKFSWTAFITSITVVTTVTGLLWAVVSGSTQNHPNGVLNGGNYNESLKGSTNCLVVPEYDRSMKRVVISLSKRDLSLRYQHEMLNRLPSYSEIILLVPKRNVQFVESDLRSRSYSDRIRFIQYDSRPKNDARFYLVFPEKDKLVQVDTGEKELTYTHGSLWARDLFLSATKHDGTHLLLISDVHKWFISHQDKSSLKVVGDNFYLGALSSVGMEVRRLPVTFDGGNVFVDRYENKRIVICGGDVFRCTKTVWKSTRDFQPGEDQITEMLHKALNVDHVVVVGSDRPQPSLMFHLDQAMTLLPNRTAGVTFLTGATPGEISRVKELREIEIFLSKLRSTLTKLGYNILNIEVSVNNALNYQYYVNGIPYIDAVTNKRIFLMPTFPSSETPFERNLIEKNTDRFESLGYRVVHVPTSADNIHGGIHCLANVVH